MLYSRLEFNPQVPGQQKIVHTLTLATQDCQTVSSRYSGLEISLQADGQVDGYMEVGPDAINRLDDPRILKFQSSKEIPEGFLPIGSHQSPSGFENDNQLYLSGMLNTWMDKDGQHWSHSIDPYGEAILVVEPVTSAATGPNKVQHCVSEFGTNEQVYLVADKLVGLSYESRPDDLFRSAQLQPNLQWQAVYPWKADDLGDVVASRDRSIKGFEERTKVGFDENGKWQATQRVSYDSSTGHAQMSITLPHGEGKLVETVEAFMTGESVNFESLKKTVEFIPNKK